MTNPYQNIAPGSVDPSVASVSYCPIYPGGLVLYGVGKTAFVYYAKVCPMGPLSSLLSYRQLNLGCNGDCVMTPTLVQPTTIDKYLNGTDIDSSGSPTRNMVFDPQTVFTNLPIDGPVEPTASVGKDTTTGGIGVTVLETKNLIVAGMPPIRVFLLYVAPPTNLGLVDPNAGDLPPILIAFGIEVDPAVTDAQPVNYSTRVVTPYYCQVYEQSLDVIYHVRTVTSLV
jgi:hypothetical protein